MLDVPTCIAAVGAMMEGFKVYDEIYMKLTMHSGRKLAGNFKEGFSGGLYIFSCAI